MPRLPKPPNVVNRATFHDWCVKLQKRELDFHFDDDPEDVVKVGTGERTFTKHQAKVLKKFLDRAFDVLAKKNLDPFEIALNAWTPKWDLEGARFHYTGGDGLGKPLTTMPLFCPFCGKNEIDSQGGTDDGWDQWQCGSCGAYYTLHRHIGED